MAYGYYYALTFDHTKVVGGSDLTNFTVTDTFSATAMKSVANGGDVTVNAGAGIPDIAYFSDAALTVPLKFGRAFWSATAGTGEFKIKIPTLSASVDTVIYRAVGDASIVADPQDKANAIDANYVDFFTYGDGTAFDATNWTTNGNLSNVGTATATTDLFGGGALVFNGTSQGANRATSPALSVGSTLEILFKPTASALTNAVMMQYSAAGGLVAELTKRASGIVRALYGSGAGTTRTVDSTATYTVGAWSYAAAVNVNTTDSIIYCNNAAGVTGTSAAISQSAAPTLTSVGYQSVNSTSWADITCAETRTSNVARSAGWVGTTDASLRGIATFYTAGSKVSNGAATKVVFSTAPSSTVTTGVAFFTQPVVQVQDASSAVVGGDTSTVVLTLNTLTGSGTLGGTTSKAAVAGVATFTNVKITGTGTFTITASDGALTTATTGTITSGANTAPTATITAPTTFANNRTGQSVTFTGSASDAQDGALSGASLSWSSSIDGVIGTGLTFNTSTLSAGPHLITLTASDVDGLTGTATVYITIDKEFTVSYYATPVGGADGTVLHQQKSRARVPTGSPPAGGWPVIFSCGGSGDRNGTGAVPPDNDNTTQVTSTDWWCPTIYANPTDANINACIWVFVQNVASTVATHYQHYMGMMVPQINAVAALYPINRNKVYLTTWSQGSLYGLGAMGDIASGTVSPRWAGYVFAAGRAVQAVVVALDPTATTADLAAARVAAQAGQMPIRQYQGSADAIVTPTEANRFRDAEYALPNTNYPNPYVAAGGYVASANDHQGTAQQLVGDRATLLPWLLAQSLPSSGHIMRRRRR